MTAHEPEKYVIPWRAVEKAEAETAPAAPRPKVLGNGPVAKARRRAPPPPETDERELSIEEARDLGLYLNALEAACGLGSNFGAMAERCARLARREKLEPEAVAILATLREVGDRRALSVPPSSTLPKTVLEGLLLSCRIAEWPRREREPTELEQESPNFEHPPKEDTIPRFVITEIGLDDLAKHEAAHGDACARLARGREAGRRRADDGVREENAPRTLRVGDGRLVLARCASITRLAPGPVDAVPNGPLPHGMGGAGARTVQPPEGLRTDDVDAFLTPRAVAEKWALGGLFEGERGDAPEGLAALHKENVRRARSWRRAHEMPEHGFEELSEAMGELACTPKGRKHYRVLALRLGPPPPGAWKWRPELFGWDPIARLGATCELARLDLVLAGMEHDMAPERPVSQEEARARERLERARQRIERAAVRNYALPLRDLVRVVRAQRSIRDLADAVEAARDKESGAEVIALPDLTVRSMKRALGIARAELDGPRSDLGSTCSVCGEKRGDDCHTPAERAEPYLAEARRLAGPREGRVTAGEAMAYRLDAREPDADPKASKATREFRRKDARDKRTAAAAAMRGEAEAMVRSAVKALREALRVVRARKMEGR